jgi:hypothetical protein
MLAIDTLIVSNTNIANCCCLLNSEKVKRETIFGAYNNAYGITFETGVYFIPLRALFD